MVNGIVLFALDTAWHASLIKLLIAYTLFGVFAATAVLTVIALVRPDMIPDARVRKKLFRVLIVEVVVICVAAFADLIKTRPDQSSEGNCDCHSTSFHRHQAAANRQRDTGSVCGREVTYGQSRKRTCGRR